MTAAAYLRAPALAQWFAYYGTAKAYQLAMATRRVGAALRKHGADGSPEVTKTLARDLRNVLARHGSMRGYHGYYPPDTARGELRATLKRYGVARKLGPSATAALIDDLVRIHV